MTAADNPGPPVTTIVWRAFNDRAKQQPWHPEHQTFETDALWARRPAGPPVAERDRGFAIERMCRTELSLTAMTAEDLLCFESPLTVEVTSPPHLAGDYLVDIEFSTTARACFLGKGAKE